MIIFACSASGGRHDEEVAFLQLVTVIGIALGELSDIVESQRPGRQVHAHGSH
jgi:hypothetical protein